MLTEEPIKKDKTKIKMTSKSQQYAKSLRINALGNVEEKYNSKKSLMKYKFFKYLINEFDEEIQNNNINNTSRKINNNNKLKNSFSNENSKLPLYLKDINSKVDTSSCKNYLFSEKEKEVLKVLVPDDYLKNFNERYKNIENQMNEIEKETNKENGVIKSEIDSNKLKLDEINLRIKEENMKKIMKNNVINKNNKKINDLKNQINKIMLLIKEQEKKLSKTSKSNDNIRKIIEEFNNKKVEKNEEEELEEADGEEGEEEGGEGEYEEGGNEEDN